MPLQKLQFRPGVNRESTTLANEGGWFESDKVRFRSGYPEKIGGWAVADGSFATFVGVCRSLFNWATLKSVILLGLGTNLKFYIVYGGQYYDITPIRSTTAAGDVTFAATNGSSTITVTDTAFGGQTGDFVTFSGAVSLGGNIIADVLNQQYQITYVSANTYTIQARAKNTTVENPGAFVLANASDSGNGGSSVIGKYQISPGGDIFTYSTGWGAGPWNGAAIGVGTDAWAHGWGTAYTAGASGVGSQLRLWSQANFGQQLLFAPRSGSIYYWDPGSGTTPTFSNNPGVALTSNSTTQCPAQVYQVMVADASRIVIALGCNNYEGALGDGLFDPMLVRWSTNEDYSVWSPSVANQAGSFRLSRGSGIITGIQTRQEILVWTDSTLYSMQYLGPPYVFGFNILADNISIISPNAAATANGVTYWMGSDKFYAYSGRVETLPCALRSYVFDDINRNQDYQIVSGTNEGYSEIWWFYCSATSNTVDRYVIFNYLDRVWYYGSMNRTAWLDSPLRQYPQATNGNQASYLAAAITSTDTTIPLINAVGYPNSGVIKIDSEQIAYTGNTGASLTGATRGYNNTTAASHVINSFVPSYASNLLVFHEAAVDDGTTNPPSAIPAFVQSADFNIGDGHNYGFVWQIVPDITFNGSTTASPNLPQVTFTIRPRQNPGNNYNTAGSPTVASTVSYAQQNVYNVQQFTDIVYTRARGRQMALRIDSDTLGTQWQLGVPSMNVRPDGRRA
jgi:hypothetical protein